MVAKDKKQMLKEQGVFNRHSNKVVEPTFRNSPFFDPDDLAQVKYEMVRQVLSEGKSVSEAAKNFGMSRPTVYQARDAVEREGLLGLAPKKSGPQTRHKLNAEIMNFVNEKINENRSVSAQVLADLIQKSPVICRIPKAETLPFAIIRRWLPAWQACGQPRIPARACLMPCSVRKFTPPPVPA